ncbi:MAG: TM2 domain-containing protein [Sandaracinaceae bacterium]|nr:TM2 domain-containing protein [Sandaracinaceae bacterium]
MGEVGFAELASLQQGMNDHQKMLFLTQYNAGKKDRGTALLLGFLFGVLGADRFYVGDTALGVLKLLTFGFCGVMALDRLGVLIMGRTDQINRQKAQEIVMMMRTGY